MFAHVPTMTVDEEGASDRPTILRSFRQLGSEGMEC